MNKQITLWVRHIFFKAHYSFFCILHLLCTWPQLHHGSYFESNALRRKLRKCGHRNVSLCLFCIEMAFHLQCRSQNSSLIYSSYEMWSKHYINSRILFACLELLAWNKQCLGLLHTVKAVQWVEFSSTYSYVTITSYIGPVMYEVSTAPKHIAHSISSCHVARTKICLRMQISVGSCSRFHSIVCHVRNKMQCHA